MAVFSQDDSIQKLHRNVRTLIENKFPYEREGYIFNVSDLTFKTPDDGYEAQDNAFAEGSSLETEVRGNITATKDGESVADFKNVLITKIPHVTERGTYILNGNENTFLNQMNLRPGIYIHPMKHKGGIDILESEIRTGNKRFRITLNTKNSKLKIDGLDMEYGKTAKKVDVLSFLKVLGATDAEIEKAVGGKDIYSSLTKENKPQTLQSIYAAMHDSAFPGEEEAKEKIENYLNEVVRFDDKAQKVSKAMIGKSFETFDKNALLSTLSQMFKEFKEPESSPSVDDIRFKEISSSEDVIARGVESGLREWIKRINQSVSKQGTFSKAKIRPVEHVYGGVKKIYNSDLSELVASPNPLDLFQARQRVTMLGQGGLSTESAKEANRNLQDTAFAKIDPVETAQSSTMGLTQHLSRDAKIENGNIYSEFYKVNNGKIDKGNLIKDMDPLDEFDEYIAFNNPSVVKNGEFTSKEVRVRHQGKFVNVPVDKVTMIDRHQTSHLSYATNLVPFGAHNDGSRMLMGASMQKQSLSLEDPDEPLVQSISNEENEDTLEGEVADQASFLLRSPVDGTVSAIEDDYIEITDEDGEKNRVKKLNYFSPGKSGSYINHKPVVKVGDSVKTDSLLADGWQSKNGKLALGKNTLVAFMPYEGYNFEDGVVVSESFARNMASEEIKTIEYDFDTEKQMVDTSEVKKILASIGVSEGILDKLDADGVIKKGSTVSSGDIFVGSVREKQKEDLTKSVLSFKKLTNEKLFSVPKDYYKNVSKEAAGYQKGKVIDVKKIRREGELHVTIKLLSFKPMETGDKLSGRHGNKGTITKIIPDSQMPHTEDGRSVGLIFSPLAVPSRKNLGQLLEVNAGLVAEKKGLPVYKVNNFDPAAKNKLMSELEEIGLPDGKQTLINPETGKAYENKVTVGPMYIMKLKHKVEGKITARNSEGAIDIITNMPKKVSGSIDGDRKNPQSVGGMEFFSLTSAGAVNNIHELTTLKSDGAGDRDARMNIFSAIRRGENIPDPVTPETLKVLSDKMVAAGLQITPLKNGQKVNSLDEDFTSLMLSPLDKQYAKTLIPDDKEILESKTFDATKLNKDKNGLYSERIFGKTGNEWGKITLAEPMPNPLYLSDVSGPKPYEAMLSSKGITNRQLKNIVEDGQYIVLEPGDTGVKKYSLLSPDDYEDYTFEDENFKGETGSAALNTLLKDVKLEDEYNFVANQIKEATDIKQRSKLERKFRVLAAALDHDMKPQDYLMDFVPVLPIKYREPVKAGNGSITDDGITRLYQNLMKKNEEYKKNLEKNKLGDFELDLDPVFHAQQQKDNYKMLKHTIGVGTPFADPRTKQEYKGIMHTVSGKKGFLRDKMQSKKQDYSGRSVIIVDPNLSLDEVSLPEDMAAEMFKPHVLRELWKERYSSDEMNRFIKNRTPEFRKALETAVEDHPVILNRQPSLHRHSLQAFYPKIRWNTDENGKKKTERAIGLNPMVTTGFNADFDGDTMAAHVPITQAAISEAKEKLMPSKNLYNPTNGSLIMELKHEMQLGIYYMTRDKMPMGSPKQFKDEVALRKAYDKGEVSTYDSVQMNVPMKGALIATAGMHLFESTLPPAFRNYEKHKDMGKKEVTKLLRSIIEDPKFGPMKAVETMNKLQGLSFKASTISGLSIGVKDFDPIANFDKKKEFDKAEKDPGVLAETNNLVSNFIDKRDAFEQAKTNYVQDVLKDMATKVFDKDNPVEIMRASGARGNAGQITAMAGIVGVGKDVTEKATRPINSSLLEGLSPDQFWDLSYDSRKGIYDRSVATSEPGALTRQIWMANKQTVISQKDCGDSQGIFVDVSKDSDKHALRGRILLKDVPLEGGGVVRASNQPISLADYEKVATKAKDKKHIQVRSPLSCKSTSGICQLCYGAKAGAMSNELVPIGEPVGSLAAQGLGEPSQQAIMKTFHVGAGSSNIGGAFKRINQVLTMPEKVDNEAVLATVSGKVEKIETDAIKGKTVYVDKKKYFIGHKPLAQGMREGAPVQIGDPLTDPSRTFKDPRLVFELQGPEAAREYLMSSVNEAFEVGGIGDTDKRHLEIAVSNMLDRGIVDDPGTSKLTPGQTVPIKMINQYNQSAGKVVSADLSFLNKMNVIGAEVATDITDRKNPKVLLMKKGDVITEEKWNILKEQRKFVKIKAKPITFVQGMRGVDKDNKMANQEWLDQASYRGATQMISRGSGLFMTDSLSNPLTRQMTGLKGNFSDGFNQWKENIGNQFGDFV